jgi:hypothetical protein
MKTTMIRTNLYLTENQYKAIKLEAELKGIGFSERFRQIIENYLEQLDKKK